MMQYGEGLPVFMGARRQRGYGLGGVFANLFRSAVPMLKKGALALGKQALATTGQVIGDVVQGKSLKESVKARGKQSGKKLLKEGMTSVMRAMHGNKRKVMDEEPLIPQKTRKGNTSLRRKKNKKARKLDDIYGD